VTALLFALPLGFLAWVPLPDAIRAPGVVESAESTQVVTGVAGRLERIEAVHGSRVTEGQVLVRLRNPELDWEIQAAAAAVTEAEVMRNQALQAAPADVAAWTQRIAAAGDRLRDLRARRAELEVRARHAGVWSAQGLHERLDNWVPRGQALGELVNPGGLRFAAVVSQEQADRLFRRDLSGAELRLGGQAGQVLVPQRLLLLPYERDRLVSPALGWQAGGAVAVRPDDPQGLTTVDTFYELQASFGVQGQDVVALHGMTGWLRVPLPPATLWEQAERALRQLVQKRYAL
jgi:putative peptide zinc metalloprotease protein